MLFIEVMLFIIAIIFLVVLIRFKNKRLILSSILFMIAVLLIYTLIYSLKWQLYPLYVGIIIVIIFGLIKVFLKVRLSKWVNLLLGILVGLMILVSLISTIVFPIYEVPIPTGEYLIGTTTFVIEDETREEYYGDETNRRFKIQLWYPTNTIEGYEQVPWLADGIEVSRALSIDTGLPYFVLDHTAEIMSNSYLDAPIKTDIGQLPVIIISHGWRGFRNLHTDFAEQLASEGYMVVSIDHTYGAVGVVFDDGVDYVNYGALPNYNTVDDFIAYANQLVYTYAGDIESTLNYLEVINDIDGNSQFSQHLDLETVGLVGHSTGGGAGVAAALDDDRIDAVFGLDSWVESIDSEKINNGLTVPSVFLRSGQWEDGANNVNLLNLVEQSTNATLYQIDGITHYDFTMVYMYSPFTKMIGFTGDVEGLYLNNILKTMMSNFFYHHLINSFDSQPDIENWEEVHQISD